MPGTAEYYELEHEPTGVVVAHRVAQARGWLAHGVGLIGRRDLPSDEGLWIGSTSAIHTLGLRFPLDILFLDKEHKTVGFERGLRPHRPFCGKIRAHSVIELAAGALDSIPALACGDPWVIRTRRDSAG